MEQPLNYAQTLPKTTSHPNARAQGGDTVAQHRAAVDAACAAGARRIVYASHMAVSASSAFHPMRDHAAIEAMLRDAGIAWTALRNVDGGGDLHSIRARTERATEIILIDMPLWVHFWLAAERQMAWASGTIEHPPAGNRDMPPTGKLFEIIWTVDREWMPRLRALCHEQEAMGKVVTRLKSIDDLNAYSQSG